MDSKKSKEINIKEIINPYLKNWKYFLGIVFVMGILAVYKIKSTVPVYKAQTSVLIKDAKKMSAASGDIGVLQSLGGFSGMGTNSIENEIGVFESKTIVEDAVKEYNFQTPLYAKQLLNSIELYGKTSPYIIHVIQEKQDAELPKKPISIKAEGEKITLSSEEWKNDIITTFDKATSLPFAIILVAKNKGYIKSKGVDISDIYLNYSNFDSVVESFQNALIVDLLDKEGTIISLSVNFESTEKAKDYLNSLVRQYNNYAINDKNIESKRTKEFIDKRIELIAKELGDVETRKATYKSNNNIVDLPSEAKMSLHLKEQSKAQLLEIETQIGINNVLQNTLKTKGMGDVLPLNIGLDNEASAKAIQEYNTLILQRNRYIENATPDNPLVKEINKQITDIKSSLFQSLQKSITSLEFARNKVEGQLGTSENVIEKIPIQEKLFRTIERQQQIKESLYLLLLQKREEAAISMEITAEKARIIDKAFVFSKPVAPKKLYIVIACLFIGLLIPFSFIYIKQLLQSTIITRSDLTNLTQLPVIAEIPKLKNKNSNLVRFNDVSPMAESFRIFVTNLKFLLPKKEAPYVILVTSSVKGEGKTFVSTNLSIILGSVRDKVLVVGADIRNPQLQRYNPSMKRVKGLSEFLSGENLSLEEITHPSGYNENCDFIYSGSIPPNPTDLLQNGRLKELLETIKDSKKYKYIVLDTAPLLLVTDSFSITENSDLVVYVTRSEVSEKKYIDFLNNSVKDKKLNNVGIILNGVNETNFGYGNKFGYGYNAEEKKWWHIFGR
ncbi:polysaccharide biosynthesis tyrosine autokinase [Chryseobacterium sp. Ch-15]|uniref:non-specific protein-tyrosine kinase n=1 Tax=Chryseobacterium muglaense TaxID=2893752 RepID=A0A9Q3UXN5_9FLAO|nr:tyrosine-protein kinase [Chryseobacterium muglaense]MBD3905445.1 polysaccharide biosynthesis tyrosine autokinase [Chryseobacterium muglaense]MCC9036482.1 polysaccharide biosynthesis tyrosine autokinase [Chryseobacterium muglaense]MCM2555407.1 polysaccharide biosynthesis tyrosine autokinase [Chryseobacterium muglaense]